MPDQRIIAALTEIVGPDGVVVRPSEVGAYVRDPVAVEQARPRVVVLPATPEALAAVVGFLHRETIAFTARGAGTGGALGKAPVMIGTSRLRNIAAVDVANRRVVAEAGAVNGKVEETVRLHGLRYVPDPLSRAVSTIGGDVAENAGGPRAAKYGATASHVLGVDLLLPTGELVQLGGMMEDVPGYDLTGLVAGSGGTFGVTARATLRLGRQPEAVRTVLGVFASIGDAVAAAGQIIAKGIGPAALEIMDPTVVEAVESAWPPGFAAARGAVLIAELEGTAVAVAEQAEQVLVISRVSGAREARPAADEEERTAWWGSRRGALGAVGRLGPNWRTVDGHVRPSAVAQVLPRIAAVADGYKLRIAHLLHAAEAVIHAVLLFDERNADEAERVAPAAREIEAALLAVGGPRMRRHGGAMGLLVDGADVLSSEERLVRQRLRAVFDPVRQGSERHDA